MVHLLQHVELGPEVAQRDAVGALEDLDRNRRAVPGGGVHRAKLPLADRGPDPQVRRVNLPLRGREERGGDRGRGYRRRRRRRRRHSSSSSNRRRRRRRDGARLGLLLRLLLPLPLPRLLLQPLPPLLLGGPRVRCRGRARPEDPDGAGEAGLLEGDEHEPRGPAPRGLCRPRRGSRRGAAAALLRLPLLLLLRRCRRRCRGGRVIGASPRRHHPPAVPLEQRDDLAVVPERRLLERRPEEPVHGVRRRPRLLEEPLDDRVRALRCGQVQGGPPVVVAGRPRVEAPVGRYLLAALDVADAGEEEELRGGLAARSALAVDAVFGVRRRSRLGGRRFFVPTLRRGPRRERGRGRGGGGGSDGVDVGVAIGLVAPASPAPASGHGLCQRQGHSLKAGTSVRSKCTLSKPGMREPGERKKEFLKYNSSEFFLFSATRWMIVLTFTSFLNKKINTQN